MHTISLDMGTLVSRSSIKYALSLVRFRYADKKPPRLKGRGAWNKQDRSGMVG